MALRPLVPLARAVVLGSTAMLASGGLISCTGALDGPVSSRPAQCNVDAIPAAHPLRRLTAAQYQAMIERMFPGVVVAPSDVPDGVVTGYGYDNDARLAEPTPTVIDAYHAAAETVAAAAIASTDWIGCDTAMAACIESTVLSLAETAFRHPLDDEQEAILLDLVRTELAVDAPLPTLELAIQVILESPEFLYFPESAGAPSADLPPGTRALTGPELANRLALYLWDEPADAELVARASELGPTDDEALAVLVDQMLADPRAEAGFRRFASQWMPLREGRWGASLDRNPDYGSDAQLHEDLRESALRFLRHAFLEAGSIEDLYTSRLAWVNDRIAPLFGIDPPGSPDALVEVELPAMERAGILTHPAILLLAPSDAPYVSIHRGVMILHQVTCQTLGNPRFDLIGFDGAPFGGTTRERLAAQHLGGCGGECHVMIDGAGFPFESYDSLGRFRTFEGDYPIDSSGNVLGTPTADTMAFTAELASSPGVASCLVEHVYRYALGSSDVAEEDECVVRALAADIRRHEGELGGIARGIALSNAFRIVSESEVAP